MVGEGLVTEVACSAPLVFSSGATGLSDRTGGDEIGGDPWRCPSDSGSENFFQLVKRLRQKGKRVWDWAVGIRNVVNWE